MDGMIQMPSGEVGPAELRAAFGCFPSGITAVCALIDGEPVGMAASSFTCVSLDPPLVSVCIQNRSKTWRQLRSVLRMGVSVMASGQDLECRQLARPEGDRFEGVAWEHDESGSIFLDGAAAWLNCGIHTVVPAGDHAIVLLRVHELGFDANVEPLVFHGSRFRTLAGV
ncbi:flavin reductase (DIM6/NTAB) family NADH-FMN oxidoreductase RutF [Nocardioides daedukensis]|uniref:Flavin reductase (DIM6/NTAB) family NADH-FMN oxidoreductase RutF n=1 Tax=Nocardioides daedukensis TaxID=634462 RepID=A0A7Y9RXE7_9ACTN|nr:flavin reductase family protein [Nocardioides daedukensis]NYG57181.1 flavin reductase (DIM6/NTAB) family NADH-FMN oxidoreductase RutF [Nocardioides daedukensis]